MKKKYLFIALAISALCVGCGQQQVYNPFKPENFMQLDLPSIENNIVPVGLYTQQEINALVELPNETNTKNLDITIGSYAHHEIISLTDTEGFWKIRIHSTGYYPIEATVNTVLEEINKEENRDKVVKEFAVNEDAKYGAVRNVSPNRVTTIYNIVPWPKGDYEVNLVYGNNKAFASIQTGSSLAELNLPETVTLAE